MEVNCSNRSMQRRSRVVAERAIGPWAWVRPETSSSSHKTSSQLERPKFHTGYKGTSGRRSFNADASDASHVPFHRLHASCLGSLPTIRPRRGMLPVLSCRQTARQGVSHSTNAAAVVLSVLQPQTEGMGSGEKRERGWNGKIQQAGNVREPESRVIRAPHRS